MRSRIHLFNLDAGQAAVSNRKLQSDKLEPLDHTTLDGLLSLKLADLPCCIFLGRRNQPEAILPE
jgi:hypothetical protein